MMRSVTRPQAPGQEQASRASKEARLLRLMGAQAPVPAEGARAVAGISDATLDGWLAALERYQRACGCKSGAALGMLSLVSWPWVGLRRRRLSTVRCVAGALGTWAVVVLVGAAAGKLGGLAVAGAARRFLTRRIAAQLGEASGTGGAES